ncbi:hypothetical protein AUJ14_03955 [Candidatus Micrarchaeota archaeon CG1_02_55_22]|nr:MAG: hypothetical protein AUJ14_03955 [Candidatus Micrarchaeota archaeon CG1_02_55_22]
MARHAFYKLVDGTLEIDGVRMHPAGASPQAAAKAMVARLKLRRGWRVLDVCTGLGYTAIEAASAGCSVVTVEVDERVVDAAKANPFSAKLFGNPLIKRFLGDASAFVAALEGESFDAVLHDPPRFSFAGELYSGDFYLQLFRVLTPGGVLFHYTGKPGEKRGVSFRKGVAERLRAAGFEEIKWCETEQGFSALKPVKVKRFGGH